MIEPMPQVSFEMSIDQVRELAFIFDLQTDTVGDSLRGEAIGFFGPNARLLDEYVQRCIGTALELDAFQSGGGRVLMQDSSGEVRELHVDLTRNGGTLRAPRTFGQRGGRP